MRLAQIVSKYIDTESIKEMTANEFGTSLFNKLDGNEMLWFGEVFMGNDYMNVTSTYLVDLCITKIIENGIPNLLETFHNLGFDK